MYGLVCENVAAYIKVKHGKDAWENIRRLANIDTPSFSIHQTYPEQLVGKVVKKALGALDMKDNEFFEEVGYYFVEFVCEFGYGDVLALLGRHLRDFLNGLDNLHEYLKYSYPRLRAPSYFCDNETEQGLHLHYRSKRRGFTHYTMGQLKAIAQTFFNLKLDIEVMDSEIVFDTIHVSFKLTFDNTQKSKISSALLREEARLPAIASSYLFSLFPFIMSFGPDMVIQTTGKSLTQILPQIQGTKINEFFDIVRPIIEFKFEIILARSNNIFELQTQENIDVLLKGGGGDGGGDGDDDMDENLMAEEVDNTLHFKGQMLFFAEWNTILFLCSPIVSSVEGLQFAGLFINDLAMHDFSRDLLLTGSQKANELKDALEAETEKTAQMQEAMKKVDIEMKRSDELLSQMIPKAVAEKVKKGLNPVDTCEVFEQVTIIFNDLPAFLDICTKCDGMKIVQMLNTMFGMFDNLSDKNDIYKVETVKDSFVGVSGAPEKNKNHAEKIMDMALDMRDSVKFVHDPRPEFDGDESAHIGIRLGSHSGPVVAGIVGNKMPRYCLFGDAMNTSSRMMSFGEVGSIHVSDALANLLPTAYEKEERGKIEVKGKGEMTTYWIKGKSGRTPPTKEEVMPKDPKEEEAAAAAAAE